MAGCNGLTGKQELCI